MTTPLDLDEIEGILQFSSNADEIFKAADTLLTECRHLRAEKERLKAIVGQATKMIDDFQSTMKAEVVPIANGSRSDESEE